MRALHGALQTVQKLQGDAEGFDGHDADGTHSAAAGDVDEVSEEMDTQNNLGDAELDDLLEDEEEFGPDDDLEGIILCMREIVASLNK